MVASCEVKTARGPSFVVIHISGPPQSFNPSSSSSFVPPPPNPPPPNHTSSLLLHSYLSMEEAQNSEPTHIPIPAFPSKPDIISSVPHSRSAHEDSLRPPPHRRRRSLSSSSSGDHPTTSSRKKTKTAKKMMIKEEDSSDDDDDDPKVAVEEEEDHEEEDREEIERKIEALQRIVPGGESLGMDKLFDETADYIMALQCQIKGLRALSSLFERLEKDKSKLGG